MIGFIDDAELRDATHARDAQRVGAYEVRFTDPTAFIDSLKADAALQAIEDQLVWLSITSGVASLDDVEGKWTPGGRRAVQTYRSRYVEASYLARGQLVKGSFFAGVAWAEGPPPTIAARERTEATALRLQETTRQVQSALSRIAGVDVRSGGAMHIHDLQDPWAAHPQETIETPDELVCATCSQPIYFANKAWRHKASRRAEAVRDGENAVGQPMKILDHLADPAEIGRQI